MITMPCTKPELFKYSPHQSRMLLLDQVDSYNMDKHTLQSSLEISEDSEFFSQESGSVPTWISFEYVAQSIALLSGIANKELGNEPKIGFIMAVRDFKSFSDGFKPGSRLEVTVEEDFRNGDVAVFNGVVKCNDSVCATTVINVIENNQELVDRWLSE